MNYFREPVFDLLKLGQAIKRPLSRRDFASHVLDLAAQLSLGVTDTNSLNQAREFLHTQIARLSWKTYIWVFPVQSHALDHSIYPATGYEYVIPESLLGTAIRYRGAMHSSDPEARRYCRSMIRSGLEWACHKALHEGRPNPHDDMPRFQSVQLNALLSTSDANGD